MSTPIIAIVSCLSPSILDGFRFPRRRRWRYERNFERLIGVNQTINPRRPKSWCGLSVSGTGI